MKKKTLSTILVLILLTSMMVSLFPGTLNIAKADDQTAVALEGKVEECL